MMDVPQQLCDLLSGLVEQTEPKDHRVSTEKPEKPPTAKKGRLELPSLLSKLYASQYYLITIYALYGSWSSL